MKCRRGLSILSLLLAVLFFVTVPSVLNAENNYFIGASIGAAASDDRGLFGFNAKFIGNNYGIGFDYLRFIHYVRGENAKYVYKYHKRYTTVDALFKINDADIDKGIAYLIGSVGAINNLVKKRFKDTDYYFRCTETSFGLLGAGLGFMRAPNKKFTYGGEYKYLAGDKDNSGSSLYKVFIGVSFQ